MLYFFTDVIIEKITVETSKIVKKRKFIETEDDLKIDRLRNIIKQEQQLAKVKLEHEEMMATIKETHLNEINKAELKMLLAKAAEVEKKIEITELLLKKEKGIIP